jgi:hypothetical protein
VDCLHVIRFDNVVDHVLGERTIHRPKFHRFNLGVLQGFGPARFLGATLRSVDLSDVEQHDSHLLSSSPFRALSTPDGSPSVLP